LQQTQRKKKTCPICKADFQPTRPLQRVDSPLCALEFNRRKDTAKRVKADRERLKGRKEALKTRSGWMKEVQHQYNRYIRARDEALNLPCISCGEFDATPINGCMWDCGHYLSVGSHPELRFNELNANRQHAECNRFTKKNNARNERTMQAQYRIGLIDRIGLPLVNWLEGPHKPLKLTIDELKVLKKYYNALAKQTEAHNKDNG
jgi:hypothetical protein